MTLHVNLALPQKLCHKVRSQVSSVTVYIFLPTEKSIVGQDHGCGLLVSGEQGMVKSGVLLAGWSRTFQRTHQR